MDFIGGPGNSFCRKRFVLEKEIGTAVVALIADPHSYAWQSWMETPGQEHNWLLAGSFLKYRLRINGDFAAAGPVRPVVTDRAVVSRFDVTALLKRGENVLAVHSRGERYGFALQLTVMFADGTGMELCSGKDWKCLNANDIYSSICWSKPALGRLRGSAGPGETHEHIDGTRYPFGWDAPGFDDSGWVDAVIQAAGDVYETEECTVPPYEETEVVPATMERLSDGGIIVDFGRSVAGGIKLACPQAALVELRLGEELLPYGGVRFQMRTGNCYQEGWSFPGGGGTLSHFGFRSFRYAELLGYPGELAAGAIRAVTLNSPFCETDSEFHCSDKRLERVWEFCKDTIRVTTQDVYQDCPSRERIAYEADAYINMLTHFAVESRIEVARRTILYQMNHYTWPCEWRLFMAGVVYEYYMHTGDDELLEDVYDRLVAECSFHQLLRDGLVPEFPMRIIVDWPASCRDNYEFGRNNAVANAFQYWTLDCLAKLAGYLGRNKEQQQFAALAAVMKKAFNTRLYDPEQRLFVDNSSSSHAGFHANVFALAFGVADKDKTEAAAEFIDRAGMRCSVYGAQFYLEALFRHGRAERAIELMTSDSDRSWLNMLAFGATATTEAWNPELKPNMSFVHPWGSAPGNIIQRFLFGLRPTAPGWKSYEFKPQPGILKSGSYVFRTPAGKIEAIFEKDGEKCHVDCKLV